MAKKSNALRTLLALMILLVAVNALTIFSFMPKDSKKSVEEFFQQNAIGNSPQSNFSSLLEKFSVAINKDNSNQEDNTQDSPDDSEENGLSDSGQESEQQSAQRDDSSSNVNEDRENDADNNLDSSTGNQGEQETQDSGGQDNQGNQESRTMSFSISTGLG